MISELFGNTSWACIRINERLEERRKFTGRDTLDISLKHSILDK